jgi:hypothetical protein
MGDPSAELLAAVVSSDPGSEADLQKLTAQLEPGKLSTGCKFSFTHIWTVRKMCCVMPSSKNLLARGTLSLALLQVKLT